MTKITMTKVGSIQTVIANDHAAGSPETCAAISMLIYTLAGWTHNCSRNANYQLLPGDAAVVWEGHPDIWDLCKIGFLQLQQQYPEYCQVEIAEK